VGVSLGETAVESAYYREFTDPLRNRVTELEAENQVLDREASLNPVSEFYNERGLQRKFDELVATDPDASRAVIAVDLGSFKAVNDELGHHRGDELLRQIGQLFRVTDIEAIVANPHGDEFVVVTNLDARENFVLSEKGRIQAIIDRLKGVGAALTLQDVALERLNFSISAGGVIYEPGTPLKQALNAADAEMYRDKEESLSELTPEQAALIEERRDIDRRLAEAGLPPRQAEKYVRRSN
jgi:diguanylate cyclase (GGDEF)-like protein